MRFRPRFETDNQLQQFVESAAQVQHATFFLVASPLNDARGANRLLDLT